MYRLSTLGTVTIARDGKELRRLSSHRQKMALITYLALEGPTARDSLLGLFWGEREQERARHSLSQTLYELRRDLGEDFLDSTADRLSLAKHLFEVDVLEFQAAADEGRWADALSVYGGMFLPGFYLDAPGFESWLEAQRARFERLQRRAHQELLKEACRGGDLNSALAVARRWVANDPLHDEAQRQLIEVLGAAGYRSEAIQQFEHYAARLKREYDLEPLDEIRGLVDRIRAGEREWALPAREEPPTEKAAVREQPPKAKPQPPAAEPATFLSKLRRRRIVQVLLMYAGFAYVSMDVANIFQENLELPRSSFIGVLILLLAGVPVSLLLAWTEEQPGRAGAVASAGKRALTQMWRPVHAVRTWAGRVKSIHVIVALALMALMLLGAREGLRPRPAGLTYALLVPMPGSELSEVEIARTHESLKIWLEEIQAQGLTMLDAQTLAAGEKLDRAAMFDLAREHGAKYVVTWRIWGSGSERQLQADVYLVATQGRVGPTGTAEIGQIESLIPGGAARVYGAIARREGWPYLEREAIEDIPAVAQREYYAGLEHFRQAQYDLAAEEFRRAVATDTAFALAYLHLSLAEYWRRDPSGVYLEAAVEAVREALKHGSRLSQRGLELLRAHEAYMRGAVSDAISRYELATERYPDDVYVLLGLAESYYHLGPYAGRSHADARRAWERLILVDTAYAPAYYHLVDLVRLDGDSSAMKLYLDQFLRYSRDTLEYRRRTHPALWAIEFGGPALRDSTLANLPPEYWELIKHYVRGGRRLVLADAVAREMTLPEQLPGQRQRGHEYRFVTLAAMGRWDEAIEQWRAAVRAGADSLFNAWVVMSYLAGYPAESLARPMLAAAETRLADPAWPDTALNPAAQESARFGALVQYAAARGDSSLIAALQQRLARYEVDRYDALTPSYQAALRGRLALLASDTTAAITALRESLSRFSELWSAYLPATVLAHQRLLLAELLIERGDYEGAILWLDSFEWTFAIVDAFFLRQARELARIAKARMEERG